MAQVPLVSLPASLFFTIGNLSTLARVQWKVTLVVTPRVSYSTRSHLCVALNTFAVTALPFAFRASPQHTNICHFTTYRTHLHQAKMTAKARTGSTGDPPKCLAHISMLATLDASPDFGALLLGSPFS